MRRRYQRSNKRFEFTTSQIQRIEREEERDQKAKQLREREKKKLANKKKKLEKEAKEREERRRLGIPDPNTGKIPASQPLLVNFFGAGRKKVGEVKEQTEGETEDSAVTQESDSLEDEEMNELEADERNEDRASPVPEETIVLQHQQEASKTDDTANCLSEEFSDLETELGDDWLDDVDLEKHMASIENSQKSLSSSAATRNDDQPTEPAQSATSNWAGMTESFEDDTSLMLQSLDPTVLEKYELPQQPKVVLHEVNTKATSDAVRMSQHSAVPSPSVSKYAVSIVRNGNAQYVNSRVNNLTPTNFRSASLATNLHTSAHQPPHQIRTQTQQFAQKQQPRTTATSNNTKLSSVQNTPSGETFKKPAVAASMQPRRHLHFSPKKSFNQSNKTNPIQKVYHQPHFDAEDEFGDLPLSTQDVRDLDSIIGLG